ncbi:MAG TPA: FecR family protein, partial [Croceibacterium sp.]|nr:FecR family protein [Croceibacterium sp.]
MQLQRSYAFSAAVAGACFAAIILAVVVGSQIASAPAVAVQSEVFLAGSQAGRSIRLADGSAVILAPASELRVDLTPDGRTLRLMQGMARFKVFHDGRRFVVTARDTKVVARGTQFVVRLGERETLVSLIEGQVDVYYPAASGQGAKRMAALRPGQRLMVPIEPPPQ